MAVTFDTTFLIPLLDPKAKEPVADTRIKVRYLVAQLDKTNDVMWCQRQPCVSCW